MLSRASPSICSFHTPSTPEIYTLSLHDALPICAADFDHDGDLDLAIVMEDRDQVWIYLNQGGSFALFGRVPGGNEPTDRKSTRLNSSHVSISYAVFCLKKKKQSHPHEPSRPTHC